MHYTQLVKKKLWFLLLLLLPIFLVWRPQVRMNAQSAPPPGDNAAQTLLIRCGVADIAGKAWTGSLEPVSSDARILSLRGYHFQPPDSVDAHSFSFSTRPWVATFQQVDLSPARPGMRAVYPNGIYAALKGQPASRYRLTLADNSQEFALSDLTGGKMVRFAGGNVELELSPTPQEVSGRDGEADFPAIAAGSSGKVAIAWQEFITDRDVLLTREFDGSAWSKAESLDVAETRDIFRPTLAYDGAGALHVIWSAQVDGNWDLYERRKTGRDWSAVERLTSTAGSDLHQKVIADSAGDLWIAWQSFRGGQSDIYLKRYTGGKWGTEIQVSASPANDWEPALAAAPDGTVWVGWDSYDRGNYDVFARAFRKDSKPEPIKAIARSPRFEAHVSLASDAQGRLWIAFDEAEANWGKDYGYLSKDRGNPLYQSRKLRVVRLTGDRLEEPASPLSAAFPLGMPEYLQSPQLSFSRDGKLNVVALQLSRADQVVEVWGVRGVWENVAFTLDGSGWNRHRVLPDSTGAHDIRAAVVAGADGTVWTAWAADGRAYPNGRIQRQTVHVAALGSVQAEAATQEVAMKPYTEATDLSFPTHLAETANLKTMRTYRIRNSAKEYRILRGDLHRHTSLSQDGVGDGSLWDLYRYVLDAAAMDYSSVTDHQAGGTDYNWWKIQKSADLFLTPGRLTTLYAYERSVPYPNGHRNIVLPTRGVPILPIAPEETQQGKKRSADAVLPYLRKYNAIAFRHTTATSQGTDWKDHNNELEPMVEIYQGHRVVYEHEGGPKGATAEKLYMHRSGYEPAGFFWNALSKGYRMGIQASSDHCSTHLSYACILAENDSREGLMDAMRKRHTYGATDNIVLDLRVKAGAREYIQGDEIEAPSRYTIIVNAIGTGAIRRIDLIRNERYAYAVTPAGKSNANFSYTDPQPLPGENRYYVRVEQEDGNLAWSSPVWILRKQ